MTSQSDAIGHPHGDLGTNSNKSLAVSHIGQKQSAADEEVSQAVSVMEEILNPSCPNTGVKGQAIKQLHKRSAVDSELFGTQPTRLQEMKDGREGSGSPQNETLPLAEQSTNEEEGSKVKGLPWATSYDKVEEAVQAYEIETTSTFLMGNPDRDFGKTFDEIKHSHHIHLDGGGFGTDLSPKLSLEGIPYIMMGNRRLVCHHGKPHNHSAKKIKGKRRLCTQASKKVGCPSHIIIRHVMLLPDFRFDKAKITEHRRRELSKHIKATWKEKQITTESRFYIEFPDVSSHRNHPLGEAAGVKQPIDKRVNERMLQLISDGMKSIPLIEKSIKDYVRDELFKDAVCPPYSNRRFFPTQKDIANRIFKVSVNSHSAKLKKVELEKLASDWIEEQRTEDGFMFFRNTLAGDRAVRQENSDKAAEFKHESEKHSHEMSTDFAWKGNSDPVAAPPKEGLLFVYQTRHQRRLLSRYGCDLTLLDPAYRVAAYAIPLYFLLVPTNCDYQVVALIVIEKESLEALQEALSLLRRANPSWKPQQFMVDSSEEEIQLVESLFPECQVSITDVRRQQAWERWLGNPKHGTAKRQQELLAKMNDVATARTPEGYQAAMDTLKGAWAQPNLKQMRAWFREKWMTNVQRWAYVYRQPRQLLPLLVSNGIESQQEALRYPFIVSNRQSALHSMLQMLVSTVLPYMQTRYEETNRAWSAATNSGLPPPLHNRPQPFLDHCQQRMPLARRIGQRPITQVNQNILRVPGDPDPSGTDGESLVDLSVPSCTCEDFQGTGFLCVHLLACITDGSNNLLWDQLPSSYLFSPFLTVDEGRVMVDEQSLGSNEDDECTTAVSGLSPEEEATSNLEAILAAVEAQTLTESTNPSTTALTSTTDNPSLSDEASRCQTIAKELLDLTYMVTDREALANAHVQMETIVTTLRQALPRGKLHDLAHQSESSDKVVCAHVMEAPVVLDEEIQVHPPKRQRLADGVEEKVQIAENSSMDSEIQITIDESQRTVEVYHEDGCENIEADESIVTETIDLQHGAVFILDPSGVMRNFQIDDASPTDTAVGSVIIKDS